MIQTGFSPRLERREKLAADSAPQIPHRTPPPKRLRRRLSRLARPKSPAPFEYPVSMPVPQPTCSPKRIPVASKSGEIPAPEKFYYLELLRRAGWLEQLADEPHTPIAIPDAALQRATQTLSRKRRKPHARPHRRMRRRFPTVRPMLPPSASKSLNALLSSHRRRRNSLWHSRRTPVSTAIALRLATRPHQPHVKTPRRSPRRSFPSATYSSSTIPLPCTSPRRRPPGGRHLRSIDANVYSPRSLLSSTIFQQKPLLQPPASFGRWPLHRSSLATPSPLPCGIPPCNQALPEVGLLPDSLRSCLPFVFLS